MDRTRIIDALGLTPGGTFSVTELQLHQWGREVSLTVDYIGIGPDNIPDDPVNFTLTFVDCREIRVKTYAHIALAEIGTIGHRASLAEIAFGHGNHRRDANLLTSHFALTLSYGTISLRSNDMDYPFDEY